MLFRVTYSDGSSELAEGKDATDVMAPPQNPEVTIMSVELEPVKIDVWDVTSVNEVTQDSYCDEFPTEFTPQQIRASHPIQRTITDIRRRTITKTGP